MSPDNLGFEIDCKRCKSYGYIKVGNISDPKPYKLCPECKGEAPEVKE